VHTLVCVNSLDVFSSGLALLVSCVKIVKLIFISFHFLKNKYLVYVSLVV